jgi:hypothetical protein
MSGTKPNPGTAKDGRRRANPGNKPGPKKGSHNRRKQA